MTVGTDALDLRSQNKLDAQLKVWQDELLNLTRRNSLLYFKHSRSSSLEIVGRSTSEVFRRLDAPGWQFYLPSLTAPADDEPPSPPAAQPTDNELLVDGKSSAAIKVALRNLERKSSQSEIDTGLWTLYLGIGMMRWVDPADGKEAYSPIFLQPVRLITDGVASPFRLVRTDGDPVLNPALKLKLARDFGVDTDSVEAIDNDPDAVMTAIAKGVATQAEWRVDPRMVLATFTFHKAAMYQDLVDNADLINVNDHIRAMALGATAPGVDRLFFQPVDEREIDRLAPPEDLVSVRDADSTQRACIVAARDGRSFVMHGPPGTGKSQTIVNMIAEILQAGRSVLFVSEKVAALEVVHKRLEQANLSEFVLELHSSKATRKEFAAEMGRALEQRPAATSRFTKTQRAELLAARRSLNEYALAMNEQRLPLERSLHQVVGRITQLQALPQAPVTASDTKGLTPETLQTLLDAAGKLSRAWGPIERGDAFLWRAVESRAVSAARLRQVGDSLQTASSALRDLSSLLGEIEERLNLGLTKSLGDARLLGQLVSLVESNEGRQRVPVAWLVASPGEHVQVRIAELRATAQTHRFALEQAQLIGGRQFRSAPHTSARELKALIESLSADAVPVEACEKRNPWWIDAALSATGRAREVAERVVSASRYILQGFELRNQPTTRELCESLSELANYVGSPLAPEASWFDPVIHSRLGEAESTLTSLSAEYRSHRQALQDTFSERVLDQDLVALRARLRANSGLHRLGQTYRADKAVLASCSPSGQISKASLLRLDDAILWQELNSRLKAAEARHGSLLGLSYTGPATTDFDHLHRSIEMSKRVLHLAGDGPYSGLAKQLAAGATPSHELLQAANRLTNAMNEWATEVVPLFDAASLSLPSQDIGAVADWVGHVTVGLMRLKALVDNSNKAIGRTNSATDTSQLLDSLALLTRVDAHLAFAFTEDAETLGPRYTGHDSDFDAIASDLSWADAIRSSAPSQLEVPTARHLIDLGIPANQIIAKISAVEAAWQAIAEEFKSARAKELTAEFRSSLMVGEGLIGGLASTTHDIDEWARYTEARGVLIGSHLAEVVAFVEGQPVDPAKVTGIVERSILEGWVDSVIANDKRLHPLSSQERAHLAARFQELDRDLVRNAAASVIEACSAQRPTTLMGITGLIRREAEKKTRHKPIRLLLGETKEVALLLKPCFMMSPLSVSQFLPPDLRFDVVIFDEASQIKPADAANCIYRGRQLIVAGDQKQLPPSNFFDSQSNDDLDEYDEEDVDNFESLLDACRASGLTELPLRWHYRSQHESLITFSNREFYKGKLLTFPSATESADDLGVALIDAGGVYRRGGARDNPIEAQKVVERIVFHRQRHPHMTMGAVAFSSAQESAIVAEIDRQADNHPELVGLLTSDRLDGFFVKNLENVQGDERDIILLSVGYGPDENGRFTAQLGPLGKQGGERRLNVAVTRARRRLEIVSSVRASQFPNEINSAGVRHLQRYLDFAERGDIALSLDLDTGQQDTESPFEDEVLRVVREMGFEPIPQVGVAGFRIDIGAKHLSRPGAFILGIECDGAAYHSSRSARDRDRLRQEILEGLGWRIHRIWGPAWYQNRSGEETALRRALEAALEEAAPAKTTTRPVQVSVPIVTIASAVLDELPQWTEAYAVAKPRPATGRSFIDPKTRPEIWSVIVQIVEIERPIHIEVLRKRVINAFDISRSGSNVAAAYDEAFSEAIERNLVFCPSTEFVTTAAGRTAVRVPTADPDTNRRVDHVAPAERQRALWLAVLDAHRISKKDLIANVARLFGWKRVGSDIQAGLAADLTFLAESRLIQISDDDFVTGRQP
jgi:hypothetical protein